MFGDAVMGICDVGDANCWNGNLYGDGILDRIFRGGMDAIVESSGDSSGVFRIVSDERWLCRSPLRVNKQQAQQNTRTSVCFATRV